MTEIDIDEALQVAVASVQARVGAMREAEKNRRAAAERLQMNAWPLVDKLTHGLNNLLYATRARLDTGDKARLSLSQPGEMTTATESLYRLPFLLSACGEKGEVVIDSFFVVSDKGGVRAEDKDGLPVDLAATVRRWGMWVAEHLDE